MWNIEFTSQFKKDYKRCKKRGLPEEEIKTIMQALIDSDTLPPKNKDHKLKGKYDGFGECHIRPDWLLIYLKEEETQVLVFTRTGTHSDLFD